MRFTRELCLKESIRSYIIISHAMTLVEEDLLTVSIDSDMQHEVVILSREAETKIGPGISVMLANWNLYDREKIVPLSRLINARLILSVSACKSSTLAAFLLGNTRCRSTLLIQIDTRCRFLFRIVSNSVDTLRLCSGGESECVLPKNASLPLYFDRI